MTVHRPETIARALLQLLADSPMDARADTPVSVVWVEAERMERTRRKYLRLRAQVQAIAVLGASELTAVARLKAVDELRALALVDAGDLATAAAAVSAREDAALALALGSMAEWSKGLKPWERQRQARTAATRETTYGPPEPIRRVDRLIYDDTHLRDIVRVLADCDEGDGLDYEDDYLGHLDDHMFAGDGWEYVATPRVAHG